MICRWVKKREDYWTNIGSPDFDRDRKQRGYLETPEQGLSSLNALKKNSVWQLLDSSPKLLRQDCTKNPRLVMRRCASVSGGGGPARTMSELRRENRETGLDSEESLLHKAFFFLCGAKMSSHDSYGRCKRTKAGLANRESLGEGIYAGAASEESSGSAPCNRDRRNISTEGAYLPDRGKRSGKREANLVRRGGSF